MTDVSGRVFVMHSSSNSPKRVTIAGYIPDGSNEMRFAYARCHKSDTFLKKVGREKAIGRALSSSPKHAQYRVTTLEIGEQSPISVFITTAKTLIKELGGIPKETKRHKENEEQSN